MNCEEIWTRGVRPCRFFLISQQLSIQWTMVSYWNACLIKIWMVWFFYWFRLVPEGGARGLLLFLVAVGLWEPQGSIVPYAT